jgi:hypothetical protein
VCDTNSHSEAVFQDQDGKVCLPTPGFIDNWVVVDRLQPRRLLQVHSRSVPTRNSSGLEQPMSSLLALLPPGRPNPPDHVGTPSPTSPRRRDHVPQPPVLNTSLSTLQYPGNGLVNAGLTPSTTLSSPFSHANPSAFPPYTPSPGGALRGTSPMASRQSGGYATAYNPQEWGPVAASPQVGAAPFAQIQQRGGQLQQQQQRSHGQFCLILTFQAVIVHAFAQNSTQLTIFSRVCSSTSVLAPTTRSTVKI